MIVFLVLLRQGWVAAIDVVLGPTIGVILRFGTAMSSSAFDPGTDVDVTTENAERVKPRSPTRTLSCLCALCGSKSDSGLDDCQLQTDSESPCQVISS